MACQHAATLVVSAGTRRDAVKGETGMNDPPSILELHDRYALKLTGSLEPYLENARHYQKLSRTRSTWKSYFHIWNVARRFAITHGVEVVPMSSAVFCAILVMMAERYSRGYIHSFATVVRLVHLWIDEADPTETRMSKEVLRGVLRDVAERRPVQRKLALLPTEIVEAIRGIDDPQMAAALALGYCGATRRREEMDLDIPDVVIGPTGMSVTIRKSKTDQEANGAEIFIERGTLGRNAGRYDREGCLRIVQPS
jgi:hypothetical protein